MTQMLIQNILHPLSTGNRCRKLRNHPYSKFKLMQTFTRSFIHTNDATSPSDLAQYVSACSWGFFFLFLLGPAELRSCNFRACKYFTGNDCGKPRKWHRLSSALLPLSLSIYTAKATLGSLLPLSAAGTAHYLSDDLPLFVPSTDRWAADFLIASALVYHCEFPPQQSNTCLLFSRPD